jgi:hypothetical protein
LQLLAAVWPAAATGVTFWIVDVGLDRATVAWLDARHFFANRQHFHAQFVPQNSRVRDERHFTEVSANIGSANADAMDADQRFARLRLGRLRHFDQCERLGKCELQGVHG